MKINCTRNLVAARTTPICSRLILCLMLTSCGPGRLSERYSLLDGPDPSLDAGDLHKFTDSQLTVLNDLTKLAGLSSIPPPNSPDWILIVDAGRLYVDKVCEAYIDALFWLDRWRDSAKSDIALTGAATTSAMGILDAAASQIALAAAAFGLSGSLVDTGANTVLYSIDPSAVRTALDKSRIAYREGLKRITFRGQADTLSAVQGYLTLCLPATLETTINTAVSTATITETNSNAGGGVNLLINAAQPSQTQTAGAIDARQPIVPNRAAMPSAQIQGAISEAEKQLTPDEARAVQGALCLKPDGTFGNETRQAIAQYRTLKGRGNISSGLLEYEIQILLSAHDCDRSAYRNPLERFGYETPTAIQALQKDIENKLNKLNPTSPRISLHNTGQFDPDTRSAIARLQRLFQQKETATLTFDFLSKLAERDQDGGN